MFRPLYTRAAIAGVAFTTLLCSFLIFSPTSQATPVTVNKNSFMYTVAETYKAFVLAILKIDGDHGVLLAPSQMLFRNAQPTITATPSRGAVDDLISIARRFIGIPYCYGANGPRSFDCSGFVRYVFALHGVDLPRVAADQALAGKRVAELAPGDLVFFSDRKGGYITHVGIYVGNNSFIHASTNKGVTITSLDETWYKQRYAGACRVL